MKSKRPELHRASRSSAVELVASYKRPTLSSAALQRQAVNQYEQQTLWQKDPILNHLFFVEHDAKIGYEESYNRGLTSRLRSRAVLGHKQQELHDPQHPTKPHRRPKARRTATCPQESSPQEAADQSPDMKPMSRSKKVDAEVATQSLLAVQPVTPRSIETMDGFYDDTDSRFNQNHEQKKGTTGNPQFPGLLTAAKSQPAGPATTHTDVHVIAIAPSESIDDEPEHPKLAVQADPPIPTMQLVESNSGYYEVIWDDVPQSHSAINTRRRSSATASLNAASSTSVRGLQRVNSKLTDWSGSWNAPSNTFKPTIVVFPDDNGKVSHGNVIDDDGSVVAAPPNSQMTSASHSRLSSQPASAPLTRSGSQEQLIKVEAAPSQATAPLEDKQSWIAPLENALDVPKPDMKSTRMLNANRRPKQAPKYRKLSNIEEADLRFRGHRDSVTLAHARLMRSGGVSPELFARHDSILMAKKRMHARNQATSETNHISPLRRQDTPQIPAISLDDSVLNSTKAKEHAILALGAPKPRSILGPRSEESLRRVRISE